jgi:hypothetical protein
LWEGTKENVVDVEDYVADNAGPATDSVKEKAINNAKEKMEDTS